MKTSKIITLFAMVLTAVACHRMQDIGGGAAGSDADTDADSDSDTDGDYDVYGFVNLAQRTTDVEDPGYLTLSAAFYAEPFDAEAETWVESRTTPDGVVCDIYLSQGLSPDPPDPPPNQVDGGGIKVGAPELSTDLLHVEFEDDAYTVDHRTEWDQENPIPDWLVPGSFHVAFDGEGHGAVAAFDEQVEVSPIPEMSLDSPGLDEAGNYIFEWDGDGADDVVFSLHFNMDWDNSSFICPVDAGVEQIMIPEDWINQYSWGGGELALFSRDQAEVAAGGGLVLLNVTRAHTVPFVSASD